MIHQDKPNEMTASVEGNRRKIRRCLPVLWFCMAHPARRRAGSSTYSAGLIRAAAGAGASITLLTYGEGSALPGTRICLASSANRPRWQSLASPLPGSAWALESADAAQKARRLLEGQPWAAAVIDHAAMGWVLPAVRKARVPLVYISHNHEASVRPRIARQARPVWRRPLLAWDAAKFAKLERSLAQEAALITAITKDDAALYRRQKARERVSTLTPGYAGGLDPLPPLTSTTPRRVMLLGRYDWVAKRENLARWAADGVPLLAAAGVETAVIGYVPEALQARLQAPGLRFLGEQQDMAPSLTGGRIGLVAEALGGGFKMKTLDYIFHGLPIAALPGGLHGLPTAVADNAVQAASPRALAETILAVIDDLPRLQGMRAGALAAAREAFAWEARGEMLVSAIEEHCLRGSESTG